jgi:hypothetical protein
MTALLEQLKQPHILKLLLFITVPLIAISKWAVSYWGLELLDGISDPNAARTLLGRLSPEQNLGHIWFTATLDVILPFAAAGLFASLTLNAFGKYALYLAVIPLIAIPIDLSEGVIQVLALTETADLLAIKAYTTPVKEMIYHLGFLLALVGLAKMLLLRMKN